MTPIHRKLRTLVDILMGRAEHNPQLPIYSLDSDPRTDQVRITLSDLCRRARVFASLWRRSHQVGERALFFSDTDLETIVAFWDIHLSIEFLSSIE
jgi:acyl-CoA synthetase (AMP-forming)/AMP-acid ligase II